jgi:MFS family permease
VQGSAGLTSIASALILREQLGLDFYQIGLIGVASTLPWSIKPVFGLLTDLVPIGKFRRRPYLHIGPLLGFLGYLIIGLYGTSFETFFLALIFANLGLSLTDVATDGFVVEESTSANAARIQGITQASIRMAAFITSFFSGLLIYAEILTPHQMFLVVACFPLVTFIASFFIREKSVESIKVFEPAPEDSISSESTLEHYRTKKLDISIFTPSYIITLVAIFVLIVLNLVFGNQIGVWLAAYLPGFSKTYITIFLWILFGGWMASYFMKLRKLELTSSMIFVAILFILLWRINPGTGSSTFFYIKDTLGIDEKTIGFVDTISHVGSLIGVLLAVKIFDKIPLKKLLLASVLIAGAYGFTSFGVTYPTWGEWIGGAPVFSWIGSLIAVPVYFFDSLFAFLFVGESFANPITTAFGLTSMERFLYLQSIVGELVFMIAYIPLLKFAVLITPKKAEATNFAIITSIMNVGLAISTWLSGYLYNFFMIRYYPDLPVTTVQVDVINLLIWVNIITTFTCLLVLPFLKTEKFVKE